MRILAQTLSQRARSRLPWIATGGTVLLFGVVAAFGTVQDGADIVFSQTVVESIAVKSETPKSDPAEIFFREERFQRGDTISAVLERLDVDDQDIERLLGSRSMARTFRWLRPGTTVQARTSEDGSLLALWFIGGGDQFVSVERDGEGFTASEQPAQLVSRIVMKSGEITSSLFAATDIAGLSDAVATQIADIFAGDIDFHRDLRRGDRFSVVYEMLDFQGRPVKSGRVLAAEFVNQRKSYRAVWFQDGESRGGYYTPGGKNLRKAFLRSPLEFSRVTSGFAMRFHPILRHWRAHKGVDYGAPVGTRVRAAGDGMVDFAGRQGGYGNMVVLRHNGGITSAYAHLSGFAGGVRRGARVSQGDVIGYVGQTGWATGPHLHYEFRVNNQQRNPLTIAFPAAQPVPPERLPVFLASAEPMTMMLNLLANSNVAVLE